jgi:phosphoribosylaminoimidazole-succinocarboxamide synthase
MREIAGWKHLRSGKVRDLYTNDSGNLLIVASDRISAFDYILPTEIPNKGVLLTQLSSFWFNFLPRYCP